MKFSATFITLALASTALAGGSKWQPPKPSSAPQCCQNVTNSNKLDKFTQGILKALLGVDVSALNVPIGTGCTPVAVLSGGSCNTNTVTCGKVFGPQLIGVNCVPVTVNA